MKTVSLLIGVATLVGCTSFPIGQDCTIDAAGQQKVMVTIADALRADSRVNAEQYIKDGRLEPSSVYGASDHCSFLVTPWQPIKSELLWDGTLSFRINKETLEIEEWKRVDMK
jgi:hypothetical protein